MIPKSWPKRFKYAKESCSPGIHHCILQQYLRSLNPEDLYKTSKVIEEKCVHPHLQIKKITSSLKIHGQQPHPLANKKTLHGHSNYGIFASEKIYAGAEIGEYVGEICIINPKNSNDINSKTHRFSEYKWRFIVNNVTFEIDAQNVANELALINDYRGLSCAPNVTMVTIIHKGFFYFGYAACCDINKGDELLVDYGDVFWNSIRHRSLDT
jgi:hypothetical protein